MNFKKLAEQKIDELSGKTSRNVPSKNVESDSIDLVLEGLDEELSLVENNEETFEFDLDEDELEFSSEQSKKEQVQNLFDGYLGEKSETPNPLEYGPNATYRNLREGIVYKKGPDNLWETFVKDGQNGRAGQAAPGGGCGVSEVTKIATDVVLTNPNIPRLPLQLPDLQADALKNILDTTQYDTSALQVAIDNLDDFFGIYIPFGHTLVLDTPLIIGHKKHVKIWGGGIIQGTLKIGAWIYGDPSPAYDIQIEGITFNSGLLVWPTSATSNGLNAIELDSVSNATIKRCTFIGYDTCVYLSDEQNYQGISRHAIECSIDDCRTLRDAQPNTSYGRNLTHCNYFVRSADNGVNGYRMADMSITNNRVHSSICNVWLYGIDGVTISDNSFFMSSWMDRSQIKTNNIYINAVQWTIISDNKLFEPGTESIKINKFADIEIVNNVIAWPGQNKESYGIKVSGGKNIGSTSGDYTCASIISMNKIGRGSGGGIRVDSGCDFISLVGNIGDFLGSTETYFGDGVTSAGPSATPTLTGPFYGISISNSCYGCAAYNNVFTNVYYDFPQSVIDPGNRGYGLHLAGPNYDKNISVAGEDRKIISIANPSGVLNCSASDFVFLTNNGGTISAVTGLRYNRRTTIINYASRCILKHQGGTSLSLVNNCDTIIPYGGRIDIIKLSSPSDYTQQIISECGRSFDFPQTTTTLSASTRIYSGAQGQTILIGSTPAQTLTLDDNYGTKQVCRIKNRSTQSWTIAPQSGKTINGSANIIITSGSSIELYDDTTSNWAG